MVKLLVIANYISEKNRYKTKTVLTRRVNLKIYQI